MAIAHPFWAWFTFASVHALDGRSSVGQTVIRRAVTVSSNAHMRGASSQTTPSANPSGCSKPRTKELQQHYKSMTQHGGVYPVDEFRHMLVNRRGVLAYDKNHSWDTALSAELNLPFCPEPRKDGLPELQDASVEEYLRVSLRGVDDKKPVIIASVDYQGGNDYHLLQISNLLCGFSRLGLSNQLAIFALTNRTAVTLRKMHPGVRVLWHPSLDKLLTSVGEHTNIRANRLVKLVFAELILRMNREVLVSDLDTYWFEDPIAHLQALRTPSGEPVDVAAMADSCWLELNSGFVYYRPTARTHALLRNALGSQRFVGDHPRSPGTIVRLVSDNDQYLLNCGLARAAIDGLKYVILPKTTFHYGYWIETCRNGAAAMESSSFLPAPFVWHTGGFQGSYEDNIDRFAVLGLIDVDAKSGQCFPSPRGSKHDTARATDALARLCDTSPGGHMSSACKWQCPSGRMPIHAQAVLAQQASRKELEPLLKEFTRRRRRRRTSFPDPEYDDWSH